MSSVKIDQFIQLASTGAGSRDITLSSDPTKVELGRIGRLSLTNDEMKLNKNTMTAFRECLSKNYGIFGEHAFDTILNDRKDTGASLRRGDVRRVLAELGPAKGGVIRQQMLRTRFDNELMRQLDSHPRLRGYEELLEDQWCGEEVVKGVKSIIADAKAGADFKEALNVCETKEQVAQLVSLLVMDALNQAKKSHGISRRSSLSTLSETSSVGRMTETEGAPQAVGAPKAKKKVPFGLSRMQEALSRSETAVEDRVRTNRLGRGMRLNEKGTPYIYEKLKTNGVEPGFIARYDWSKEDTEELMTPGSDLSNAAIEVLKRKFGADGVAKMTPKEIRRAKMDNFTVIRDTLMSVNKNEAKDSTLQNCAAVKKFQERVIVKLDYNESDKFLGIGSGFKGWLQLPVRNLTKGGIVPGLFYRTVRMTSADEASVGAVAEAFSNDLMKLLGVPSQDLTLIKGEYSDGHPKLMLSAKFAEGYHDFDGNFLKDGRLVPRTDGNGNVIETPESIGRYKALFLLMGDRDAIGSHGQNKGIVNGKFFAIDPGHSLEGAGLDLEIHDDFSFVDKSVSILQKRFQNFSVFDDCNRSEKMMGVLKLREINQNKAEGIDWLVSQYRDCFTYEDDDPSVTPQHKSLQDQIQKRLDKMKKELDTQMKRILKVFEPQLALFDALKAYYKDEKVGFAAIDTLENLERLTSPTIKKSAHGEVDLKHLEVVQKTRVPWTASVKDGQLIFTSAKPITDLQGRANLKKLVQGAVLNPVTDTAVLSMPLAEAKQFFEYLSETRVEKQAF